MGMEKKYVPNIRDLTFVIDEVIKRLPEGESKFIISDEPLNVVCQRTYDSLDMYDFMESDYGLPSEYEELEETFFKEIRLIEKIMHEYDTPVEKANWQSSFGLQSVTNMWDSTNRRAYAIQMWDWYAVPWRYHDNHIYTIYSPRDIMGTPVIIENKSEKFLQIIVTKMANNYVDLVKEMKWLRAWRTFGIIVLCVLGFWLWVVI